jgi:hypothetical protein
LCNAFALVIFIKRDQSIAGGKNVDGELQVVVQLNAAVCNDVGIAEHYDPSHAVGVVNQQSSLFSADVNDRRG